MSSLYDLHKPALGNDSPGLLPEITYDVVTLRSLHKTDFKINKQLKFMAPFHGSFIVLRCSELAIPLVRGKDKCGQTVTFRESHGVMLPPDFQEGIIDDVPKLKMREDDILIANWMRSGTHWMWEMTHMLINNNAETIPNFKEEEMVEFQLAEVLDELLSPRVFNTHLRSRSLPEALTTERHRVIYLVRNPRDAMVSWYRMTLQHSPFEYKGKWHNCLPTQLEGKFDYGSWIDHVRDWEKVFETHPNLDVHFWHYEDMITDPLGELHEVSEFLGTNTDESFLEAVVDKCHIDRMREDKAKYGMTEDGVLHYKKGKIGTWKELFTVEQYEYFEKKRWQDPDLKKDRKAQLKNYEIVSYFQQQS